ncbi:MAG: hypothetical protein ACPG8W_25190 [Candidatus Promineifilaceae bacterium]
MQIDRMGATRIVSTPAALDAMTTPDDVIVLRVASDEAFIFPPTAITLDDAWAIVKQDSSLAGVWMSADESLYLLERLCEWELPAERPAFAQGMVAGIPAKLWFEVDRTLLLVPAPYAAEMEGRIS